MYYTMFNGMEKSGWTTKQSRNGLHVALLTTLTGGFDPQLDEKVLNHLFTFMIKNLEEEQK